MNPTGFEKRPSSREGLGYAKINNKIKGLTIRTDFVQARDRRHRSISRYEWMVSLARTQKVRTRVGSFSIHHIRPELFGGFDELEGVRVATAEKALFDLAFLSGGRSRLFTALPETKFPRACRKRELERWIGRIPSE